MTRTEAALLQRCDVEVRLEPGITYSKTPGYWEVPGHPTVVPIGASEAEWLPY